MQITIKDYFMQVRAAEREIRTIQERRRHYVELATGSGSMGGDVRKAPRQHRSRVETAGVALAGLASELDRQAREYVEIVRQAERLIAKLEQPKHRQVLELRYLAGMPWDAISQTMGYQDARSVFRVHGWALKEAEKFLTCH